MKLFSKATGFGCVTVVSVRRGKEDFSELKHKTYHGQNRQRPSDSEGSSKEHLNYTSTSSSVRLCRNALMQCRMCA